MPIRHIIFDLWGTLAQSDPSLLPMNRSELLAYAHDRWFTHDRSPHDYFGDIAKEHDVSVEDLDKGYADMMKTATLYPGIPNLIANLNKQGLHIHLLSNTGQYSLQFIDDHKETFDLFTSITLSFQIGVAKPDLKAFHAVFRKTKAHPSECLMIGDNKENDIKPADSIGMSTIHFRGSEQSADWLGEHITRVLHEHGSEESDEKGNEKSF